MRKLLPCVLMMTLLLSGCKAGGGGEESPENLAALIRGEYLNLTAWTATVSVTADYGQRVYDFVLDVSWEKDGETVLTVVEPELIAYLEYDGASLSTGPLTGEGMTPLEAVPFLMGQLTSGYMARCVYENWDGSQVLKVECRDPEGAEGAGSECALYFDPDDHGLLRAELSYDGAVVLTAEFTDFTKEMTSDDTTDNADLG